MDRKSINCQIEPPYPGLDTVSFSIRFPDWVFHKSYPDCKEEYPHLISECGMFERK